MRSAQILVGMSLLLALSPAARAQTAPAPAPLTKATVGTPEAEVRSGPSDKFAVTGRLRQGEPVQVIEEVAGGWLKIKPPTGSYSWICDRYLEFPFQNKVTAVVQTMAEAPVRISSASPEAEPIHEQVKLTRGHQVVVIGEPYIAADSSKWWRIVPPEQEARYVLKEAVRLTPAVETVVSASPAPVAPSAPVPSAPPTGPGAPGVGTPPAPVGTVPVTGQPVSYAPPRPPQPSSGPGYLRRAGFFVDGRPTYVLTDSMGRPLLYATGQQGLNLELFLNQAVELFGPITYRGDLRTNYIVVGQVRQLQ